MKLVNVNRLMWKLDWVSVTINYTIFLLYLSQFIGALDFIAKHNRDDLIGIIIWDALSS